MKNDKYILSQYFGVDNLRLAFERYKRTSDNDAKDRSGINVFEFNYDQNIKDLSERLINENYKGCVPLNFKLTKDKNSERNYTMLYVEEAIIYQAIVDKIAFKNYTKLSQVNNSVFSYRLSEENSEEPFKLLDNNSSGLYFFKKWKKFYKKFKLQIAKEYANNEDLSWLKTDISGFYDSIIHENLFYFLEKDFKVEKKIIEFLIMFLKLISGNNDQIYKSRGLPQGPQPSHFLAHLFLFQFDLKMIDKAYPAYFRYVDDIYVFTNGERNLNECKTFIDKEFKNIGLVMNTKKTDFGLSISASSRKSKIFEFLLENESPFDENSKNSISKNDISLLDDLENNIDFKTIISLIDKKISNLDTENERINISFDINDGITKIFSNNISEKDDLFTDFKIPKNKNDWQLFFLKKDKEIDAQINLYLEKSNQSLLGKLINNKLTHIKNDCIFWKIREDISNSIIDETKRTFAISSIYWDFKNISEIKSVFFQNFEVENDKYLDVWLSLFKQNPSKVHYLNLIAKFYKKTKCLKNILFQLCDEFSYLEWVQHKIFLLLASSDFNYSTDELANIFRKYKSKLSSYSKLSFYLIFINHLDPNQSFFSSIYRAIIKDEKHIFYLREFLLNNIKDDYFMIYKINEDDFLEKAKKLNYVS